MSTDIWGVSWKVPAGQLAAGPREPFTTFDSAAAAESFIDTLGPQASDVRRWVRLADPEYQRDAERPGWRRVSYFAGLVRDDDIEPADLGYGDEAYTEATAEDVTEWRRAGAIVPDEHADAIAARTPIATSAALYTVAGRLADAGQTDHAEACQSIAALTAQGAVPVDRAANVLSTYEWMLRPDPFADLPDVSGMPIGSEFAIAIVKTAALELTALASMARQADHAAQNAASVATGELADEEYGPDNWSREDWLALYNSNDSRIQRHRDIARWWGGQADRFRTLSDAIAALIPDHLLPELTPPF